MTCADAEFAALGRGPPPVPRRISLVRPACAAETGRPDAAAAPNPATNSRRLIHRIWSASAPDPIAELSACLSPRNGTELLQKRFCWVAAARVALITSKWGGADEELGKHGGRSTSYTLA